MKLTKDNYFSQEAMMEYFSVSQFKAFQKCEASALAELNGEYKRETTTSLLVGSYVDAYYEGDLTGFIEQHPEILKRDGTLKSEYIKADDIIRRTQKDRLFSMYMNGEPQVIMTGELFGYPWKVKIDSYIKDTAIVDLKVMKDFEAVYVPGEGCLPWIEYWGYDIQGAVYQAIVEQNTGKKLPFIIAGVTKEKVPDIGLFEIPQSRLDVALKVVESFIDRFADIKANLIEPTRCEKCDYCKETKAITEVKLYDEED